MRNKSSYPFLLLQALILLLFTGCNLYMDEEDTKQDDFENGDGFTAPKTIKDSITTVTYQFNEGTKMLSENYRPYIIRYRTDTLYDQTEIYLRKDTPANLLPARGNKLSTDLFDIFDGGLIHQVDAVMAEGGQIVVKAHRVTVDDVFKKLDIKSDFYMSMDTTDVDNADATRAGGRKEYGYKLKPVRKHGAEGTRADDDSYNEKDFDYTFFEEEFVYPSFSLEPKDIDKWEKLEKLSPKTQNVLKGVSNIGKKIDKALVKPFGKFDGGVGSKYKLGLKLHFEFYKEKKYIDLHGWTYATIDFGMYFNEVKGGLCIPLIGDGKKKVKRSNESVGSSTTEVDKYMVNIKTKDVPIPAGPVKLSVTATPNIVLDLFAAYRNETDDGLLYGFHSQRNISEFGFHQDPVNGKYSYPQGKKKRVYSEPTDNLDEYEASFAAGVEGHVYLDIIIKLYKALQVKITPEASLTVGYEKKLYDKYNINSFNLFGGSKKALDFGGDSNYYLQLGAGLSLSGELNFGFWSVDLFNLDILSTSFTWKWNLYPDFDTSVQNDAEKSTQEVSVYDAEVKVSKSYIYTPREAPMLAIYSAPVSDHDGPKTFVKLVRTEGESLIPFDDKTTYRYHFTVPGGDLKNLYYAVPIYLTGYALSRQYLHGTPMPFFSKHLSLNVSDMKQLNVRGYNADLNNIVYAFKFKLSGVTPARSKKNVILITVYDEKGGKALSMRRFSLGNLPAGRISQDYVFFFTGNKSQYYVQATYALVDDNDEVINASHAGINVYFGGGSEEIDDLRYDFTYGSSSKYNLLQ